VGELAGADGGGKETGCKLGVSWEFEEIGGNGDEP
jgi:hypothetical protein